MTVPWLCAALFAVATPATAQNLVYSERPTTSCLAYATTAEDREACIGAAADLCMGESPAGGTTVGMGGCLDRELRWWDAMLNRVYRELMARERARDAEDAEFSGAGNRAESLRAMQRTWIPYRDATCDYERAQWGGGTGGGPAAVGCLMRETALQALYLDAMLESY